MVIFIFFKMAAAAILDFQNFEFLTVGRVTSVELRHRAKFRRNRSNRSRDMRVSILCYFGLKMPIHAHFGFFLGGHISSKWCHEWSEPSCLYSVSIHQMASPERVRAHPITAHYSFIDLERMKGWVGLVGWPCSGRLTHIKIVTHQLPVERRTGKVRRSQTDVISDNYYFALYKCTHYYYYYYHCATQPTHGSCRKTDELTKWSRSFSS